MTWPVLPAASKAFLIKAEVIGYRPPINLAEPHPQQNADLGTSLIELRLVALQRGFQSASAVSIGSRRPISRVSASTTAVAHW